MARYFFVFIIIRPEWVWCCLVHVPWGCPLVLDPTLPANLNSSVSSKGSVPSITVTNSASLHYDGTLMLLPIKDCFSEATRLDGACALSNEFSQTLVHLRLRLSAWLSVYINNKIGCKYFDITLTLTKFKISLALRTMYQQWRWRW